MDPLPPTSPEVGGEPAVGGEPVVAGQPAGDAPAVGATSLCPQAERAPDSTPHQGVGGEPGFGGEPAVSGEPAVGGQPGRATVIPRWDPEYSNEDVAALRKRQEWWDLMSWVKESLGISPRQTLSAHTTTACQPKKASGPSGSSFKTCGVYTCCYQSLADNPGQPMADNPVQPLADSPPAADSLHSQTCICKFIYPMHLCRGIVSLSGMSAGCLLTRKCFKSSHAWSCCVIWWRPRQHVSACTQVVSSVGSRQWRSFG